MQGPRVFPEPGRHTRPQAYNPDRSKKGPTMPTMPTRMLPRPCHQIDFMLDGRSWCPRCDREVRVSPPTCEPTPSAAKPPANNFELERLKGLITRYGDARVLSALAYERGTDDRSRQYEEPRTAWSELTQALEALIAARTAEGRSDPSGDRRP